MDANHAGLAAVNLAPLQWMKRVSGELSIFYLLPLCYALIEWIFSMYASTGKAFSWGMGSSQQLAHEEDEDTEEPEEMIGKNLSNRCFPDDVYDGTFNCIIVLINLFLFVI